MASSSRAGAAADYDTNKLKDTLYKACAEHIAENSKPTFVFHSPALLDFDVIPECAEGQMSLLLQVVNKLLEDCRFKVVNDAGGIGWIIRSEADAEKYRSLTPEQSMVYAYIDESGTDGAWTKQIKQRCNLHDAVFNTAIKHLQSKQMISDMKSVEHPTRKMYIKSSLRPSEKSTGGPWFTDTQIDDVFIETVCKLIYDYIRRKTFYVSSRSSRIRAPRKAIPKMTVDEAKERRKKGLGARAGEVTGDDMDVDVENTGDERSEARQKIDRMLPMPESYTDYPTVNELTLFIENGSFFSQTLAATDIQTLLDIMVYDDIIEKYDNTADGVTYRALRRSLLSDEDKGSRINELPCGRCPVFELCEEGGPVNPSSCEYLTDWLVL